MKTFLTGVIILFAFSYSTTLADPKPIPKTVNELVLQYSKEYDVSATQMKNIMNCENPEQIPTLQSRFTKKGKREQSYGLVQINLPAHKDITYAQAIDPEFSISFLAEQLSKGNGKIWSCYRARYSSKAFT